MEKKQNKLLGKCLDLRFFKTWAFRLEKLLLEGIRRRALKKTSSFIVL